MEDNYFDIDITKLINNKVKELIAEKDLYIKTLEERSTKYFRKIETLESKLRAAKIGEDMVAKMKDRWARCKDKDAKVEFFYDVFTMLGIPKTNHKLIFYKDFNVITYLSYVYYDNQEILKDIVQVLGDSSLYNNYYIELARDFSKTKLMVILTNPHYRVNGEECGYTHFSFPKSTPYDEIFKNKHILDDDILELMLSTIKNRRGEWQMLLNIDEYANVPAEFINKVFELLDINTIFDYRIVKRFIERNISILTKENQRALIAKYGVSDNRYSPMSPKRLNKELVKEYLKDLDINTAISKLEKFGFSVSDISKYVISERATDVCNITTNTDDSDLHDLDFSF